MLKDIIARWSSRKWTLIVATLALRTGTELLGYSLSDDFWQWVLSLEAIVIGPETLMDGVERWKRAKTTASHTAVSLGSVSGDDLIAITLED